MGPLVIIINAIQGFIFGKKCWQNIFIQYQTKVKQEKKFTWVPMQRVRYRDQKRKLSKHEPVFGNFYNQKP